MNLAGGRTFLIKFLALSLLLMPVVGAHAASENASAMADGGLYAFGKGAACDVEGLTNEALRSCKDRKRWEEGVQNVLHGEPAGKDLRSAVLDSVILAYHFSEAGNVEGYVTYQLLRARLLLLDEHQVQADKVLDTLSQEGHRAETHKENHKLFSLFLFVEAQREFEKKNFKAARKLFKEAEKISAEHHRGFVPLILLEWARLERKYHFRDEELDLTLRAAKEFGRQGHPHEAAKQYFLFAHYVDANAEKIRWSDNFEQRRIEAKSAAKSAIASFSEARRREGCWVCLMIRLGEWRAKAISERLENSMK